MEFDPLGFCGPSEEAAQRQATFSICEIGLCGLR